MAEKKRQYSRALAQKRCLEAIERAILINKSEAERPFVFQVQELVVFGPLVDTDVPHGPRSRYPCNYGAASQIPESGRRISQRQRGFHQ